MNVADAQYTGDQYRQAREMAGLTRDQVATEIGVTERTVANWESGKFRPRLTGKLVQLLKTWLDETEEWEAPALQSVPTAELLAELARREQERET